MNIESCRSNIVCRIAGILAALASGIAPAQPYPVKPIEIVVHTSAGSGGDVVSRTVAEIARRENLLPQPFVVVNKVGGSGVIAYTYFKTRRGDPYSTRRLARKSPNSELPR